LDRWDRRLHSWVRAATFGWSPPACVTLCVAPFSKRSLRLPIPQPEWSRLLWCKRLSNVEWWALPWAAPAKAQFASRNGGNLWWCQLPQQGIRYARGSADTRLLDTSFGSFWH